MENLFTVNLDVLSSVLYGWRSLEATGGIRLKARGRRLKSKTWYTRKLLTLGNINRQELNQKSLYYTKTMLHPRSNKFQSKTYQANSPKTQEHNPEHKNTGSWESHQTHRHLTTHYWTLHCTPERRDPAPPTRMPTQASRTRKPWQATHPTSPTGRKLHNKEEPQTSSIQKGHPKHSNLNKMKRQRNIQQVKEHDKWPPNRKKKKKNRR